jgi:cyanophycin synthetase
MELVEIRDLDGPNIFLLEPAIKIEFVYAVDELAPASDRLSSLFSLPDIEKEDPEDRFLRLLCEGISALFDAVGVTSPSITAVELETPHHVAVAFGWSHRRFAMRMAAFFADLVRQGEPTTSERIRELSELLKTTEPNDAPLMIRDEDRRIKIIGVTGTNGKTTTTRLISHILRSTGLHVGWCSTSGVYIDGEAVIEGDYAGPSGARRVIEDPSVEVGVLETARGGILLRGLAYQSNEVSVFTNISGDHLNLQGILTIEGLAQAKSVVTAVTKPDGVAVLNADDQVVMDACGGFSASKLLVTQHDDNPEVRHHIAQGGKALVVESGRIVYYEAGEKSDLIAIEAIPIAFGGRAKHMIENALCAAGAALGIGLTIEQVRSGLRSFANNPDQNQGRLNTFSVNGVAVVLDYAHNEAGLSYLLDFARFDVQPGGRLISVIGTAGDRTDHSLFELGRIAGVNSDLVIVKGTQRYLRGRTIGEMIGHYLAGIAAAHASAAAIEPSELDAVKKALELARAGDAIAIMAHEQTAEIVDYLRGLA